MPTNRFGYSDDFVLNNGNVGINSAIPQEKLDVAGSVRGDNVRVAGVSSFTTYEGFLNANQNIVENINLEAGQGITGSLSGEVVVGTGITVTGIGSATSGQGYIDSLKVYNTFTVPSGGTLDRPSKAKPGQLYYNRDFATIEFYTGTVWRQVDNTTQRGRGVFGSSYPSSTVMSYVNIASTGNAVNFGNLINIISQTATVSSSIRGVFAGSGPAGSNVMEYITIASEGNSISFGNLLTPMRLSSGASSSTRGVFAGGTNPVSGIFNTIEYISISTLGNSLDFGDLTIARRTQNGGVSNGTRGVFLGGAASTYQNVIDFITISSTGNAVDFGDSLFAGGYRAGSSNRVRGIFGGGYSGISPGTTTMINTIEYLTISTTGSSIYFGDLSFKSYGNSSCASSTRGLFSSGFLAPASITNNIIEYVNISTTGNSQDFGDLTINSALCGALSDSHGGLGGF